MIVFAYSTADLIYNGNYFKLQKLLNIKFSMLNMYFYIIKKYYAIISTSFFNFCIAVSFSLTNFFNYFKSFYCNKWDYFGVNLACLYLYIFWIVFIFYPQISFIFFKISLISYILLFAIVYLAALVLTWKSPQLTSSVAILSI